MARSLHLASLLSSPLPRRLALGGLLLALSAAACGQPGTQPSGSQGSSSSGSGGDGGGGSGPTGTPLVVLEWNTHNFFDSVKDDPSNDEEQVLTASQYDQKIQTIGGVIKGLNPDVVVLTEIEKVGILDDLDKDVLGGAYGAKVLADGNDLRGVDTAVISKIPIDKFVVHKDEFFESPDTNASYKYTRSCLEVHMTYAGRQVILLGVHFRAKGPPDDPDKRFAEAFHTREIANGLAKEDPSAAILILGDFNDLPNSKPFNAIQGVDPDKYVDSAEQLEPSQRYTYDYMGALELIDHQMANPVLAPMLAPNSVIIKHGKGIDDSSPAASDHAPLQATYLIR
jgi:endonuclease/exonuclease/phosphatase family metal-dependent hydrolase